MSSLPEDRGRLRASDADRERVLEELREHAAQGRLELGELSERIEVALRAKTLGDLEALVADLPEPPAAPLPPPPLWVRIALIVSTRAGKALAIDGTCVAIWAAAGRGTFWPIWVFIGTSWMLRRRRTVAVTHHPRHYDATLPGGSGEQPS